MKFASGPLVALFSCAILSFSPVLAATVSFNQNLIINGGAEADTGSSSGSTIGAVTGFATVGNFTVTKYGAVVSSGAFPALTSPGPVDRGLNFFSGGQSNAASSAHQLIDVASVASLIDLGSTGYELSGYLGGFSSQGDHAVLTATFFNNTNAVLGSASIGPITSGNRNNVTGLLFANSIGGVPVGTRSIDINLALTRREGSYNDGYADNLSLTLTPVPIPAAMWLFGSGLVAVVSFAQRKTNKLAS